MYNVYIQYIFLLLISPLGTAAILMAVKARCSSINYLPVT